MIELEGIPVRHVSFKDAAIGTEWKGYYGGLFINKFGKYSFSLYTKDEMGQDVCYCMSYSSEIKSKMKPNTGFLTLKYKGAGFVDKFVVHKFDVSCIEIPKGKPEANEFMDALKKHTAKLSEPPPEFLKPSRFPKLDSTDPFSGLAEIKKENEADIPF